MKPIKLKNGMKLRNGQLIVGRGNNMQSNQRNPQRKLNSSLPKTFVPLSKEGIARSGAAKKIQDTFAPVVNHHRVEDSRHPLAHATAKRPLDDLLLEKNFQGKGAAPVHPGMKVTPRPDDKFLGTHDTQMGNAVLKDAARLGKKA
jgi:hypothetical protein